MTLETDLNKMTRCMKALNGSVWMDSKLRLEWAHEHFKERLAREAKELGAAAADADAPPVRRPPPITSLRIADPELPRRRRKRSQIVVELKKSDRPNKLRFDDAGEPITHGAPAAADAAEDGGAEEPEQGRQQGQERAAEPVDTSSEAGIRRLLRDQGFLESSDDEADGPAPSATGMTARGEDAAETVDVVKETEDSMRVLSTMFGQPAEEKPADAQAAERKGPGGVSGLFWQNTVRYDPTATGHTELELEGAVQSGGSHTAVPTPMPEVSAAKQYEMGSIADLFTKVDPSQPEDTSLTINEEAAAAGGAEAAVAAAGEGTVLAGAAVVEAARPKFTLLGARARAEEEPEPCRFMRTETAEEVRPNPFRPSCSAFSASLCLKTYSKDG